MAATFDGRALLWKKGVFVIAEIGTSHGGDTEKARRLVREAAMAGADCVKFQWVIADEIIHPETGLVELPTGRIRLYESFKALERPPSFYAELKAMAEEAGLVFLCTPFGLSSAKGLAGIGARLMKVASPELNHLPLLSALDALDIPVILSSGVSRLGDIERALTALPTLGARGAIALLHCVTAYPAPEEDYNCSVIAGLSRLFGIPCGVSDHSLDPLLVPSLCVAEGGRIVEKHICLSRSGGGLDDPVALPPGDFASMVESLRRAEDEGREATLERMSVLYGRAMVKATLGSGRKALAPSEEANYGRTNRSLHALAAIAKGEAVTAANSALLRTEKVLRPGIEPFEAPLAYGRKALKDIAPGQGIVFTELGDFT